MEDGHGRSEDSFVSKYNIPGIRTVSQFCGTVLETSGHPFSECAQLKQALAVIMGFAEALDITPKSDKLFYCTRFVPEARSLNSRVHLFGCGRM